MSRVGQAIINIPNGVEVKKENNQFIVKGLQGELSAPVSNTVDVIIDDNIIRIEPKDKNSPNKAMWGTTRALINNAVHGVSVGLEKRRKL